MKLKPQAKNFLRRIAAAERTETDDLLAEKALRRIIALNNK